MYAKLDGSSMNEFMNEVKTEIRTVAGWTLVEEIKTTWMNPPESGMPTVVFNDHYYVWSNEDILDTDRLHVSNGENSQWSCPSWLVMA